MSPLRAAHLKVGDGVALLEGDLEDVEGADVGGQAGQALLAAATHTHQQGVASWCLQDAVDPADVSHRVFEQYLRRRAARWAQGGRHMGVPAPGLRHLTKFMTALTSL